MTINDIDRILRKKNLQLDKETEYTIEELRAAAIQSKDEILANVLWCYETIFKIQQLYLNAYKHLKKAASSSEELIDEVDSEKSKEYEAAWNDLDQCDIRIGTLERCFCITNSDVSDFHIGEILHDIKLIQPLFPYKFFFSRESVIKEQRCSICGNVVSVRHPCGHVPGKLYLGEMCGRVITEMELLSISVVTTPHDKYAILKANGQKSNFDLLDAVTPKIEPYCSWSYTIEKRLLPQYKRIGRNEKCPCGSGLKCKYCIQTNPEIHYENHYSFKMG